MNDFFHGIAAILIWPGLLSGVVLAWFYMWISRKLTARLQGRQGPPLLQPLFDFVKLLGKKAIQPEGMNLIWFNGLPLVSLITMVAALALLPVPGSNSISFNGDLIFLLYLLEVPAIIDILVGYLSRSIYAQVGAMREALMSLGHNIPFIIAFVALAIQANSSNLMTISTLPISFVHVFAGIALLLAIPARLKTNPFSIPNAEQEIIAGPHIEFNGPSLAIFELVHGLEIVAMSGLFASLFTNQISNPILATAIYLLVSIIVVATTSLLSASTARISVQNALKFYWRWGTLAAVCAILVAVVL